MLQSGKKFSLTFDEWTSSRNRRYMNVNIHSSSPFKDGSNFKNLGLIRVDGSMLATTCIRLLKQKLSDFDLSLDGDIVAITTDRASVMCRVGKDVNAWHQLCLAHGIQLGVIDVLYSKKNSNVELEREPLIIDDDTSDESDAEDIEGFSVRCDDSHSRNYSLHPHYRDVIIKVRNVVKLFTNSSTKNDTFLQKYVVQQEGKNLQLILDCKTRWSSLANMIERFNRLKSCVLKALIDIQSSITFSEEELDILEGVQRSLCVIKITVEALCKRDATLLTAHVAVKFMIKKLENQKTTLALLLAESLRKRLLQRRIPLASILQYLQSPESYFNDQKPAIEEGLTCKMTSDEMISEIANLIKRFQPTESEQPIDVDSANTSCTSASDVSTGALSMERQLNKEIEKSLHEKNKSQVSTQQGSFVTESDTSDTTKEDSQLHTLLRIEMTLYENGGSRGRFLDEVYNYLMTITPTSVESERAFSAANYVCNKVRSSLNDDTLDALCFLRTMFQQQQ